jgi:predicted Ser/Thr protein kinase
MDTCGACRLRAERVRAQLSEIRQVAAELPDASAAGAANLPSESEPAGGFDEILDDSDLEPLPPAHGNQAQPDTIGRYRIVGELDRGGQAVVYRAIHPTLPRDLAIKIAHDPCPIDQSLLKADAERLSELEHPNLVRVHDLDTHEGRPFVVMEFVRGNTLQQVADQARPSPRQAAEWVGAIARALAYVHRQGVVHQDIKPKNIMLDESGRPRLIDFGMARWRHAWSGKRTGPSGGTLAFMAPEQARGETERIGAPSDIFALGGVLYFLLTGKSPFGGRTDRERWTRARQCDFDQSALRSKRIPRGLERIVLKAMAAQPEDRYGSAEEMAIALEAFLNRRRRLARLVGTLVVGVMAVAAYWLWPPRPPVPRPSLKVDSFRVELHPRVQDDPVGRIGVDTFAARLGQDARINAELNMPAYCYLIALNTNGKDQLCYPEDAGKAPGATATIDFPPDPAKGFGLTDGAGTQAFVLVVSTKRLPSYAEWSRSLGGLPWKRAETETVWRYDGHDFDRVRGDVRPLADLPQPLEATCQMLQNRPGVDAIRVLAFPVRPGPEAGTPLARGDDH